MDRDEPVEYEPVSVKSVLREMKDTAELLIDLAYSSVLFENPDIAAEVLALEEEMEVLQLQARMSLVMAGRRPAEAEALAPVFGIVDAAATIGDAAADIAKVVLEDIGLPAALRGSLPDAVETLARATVAADSAYADRTLGAVNMETETGVRVLAVRREAAWLLNPDRETTLRPGDVVLCRGTETGIERVVETLTGSPYRPPAPPDSEVADLDRAVETVAVMKDTSELAVDLAYGSVLFDSAELAEEVRELEVEVDALKSRLEAWALRAAAEMDDPVALRGLLHIAASTEVISDAALEISEGVLRGVGGHPVVEAAVEESDEVIVRRTVAPDSRLDGARIGDAAVKSRTGMYVVAVRRPDDADGEDGAGDGDAGRRYILSPGPDTRLSAGDVLVAKGTRSGAERLADWTA